MMVAKMTRTVIIIRNPRSYQQFLHPSTEKSCSYTLFKRFYSRVFAKLIIIIKWLGTIFEYIFLLFPRTQQYSMNIVSLNEHMALNFNEYMFLYEYISSNGYNFPE